MFEYTCGCHCCVIRYPVCGRRILILGPRSALGSLRLPNRHKRQNEERRGEDKTRTYAPCVQMNDWELKASSPQTQCRKLQNRKQRTHSRRILLTILSGRRRAPETRPPCTPPHAALPLPWSRIANEDCDAGRVSAMRTVALHANLFRARSLLLDVG